VCIIVWKVEICTDLMWVIGLSDQCLNSSQEITCRPFIRLNTFVQWVYDRGQWKSWPEVGIGDCMRE